MLYDKKKCADGYIKSSMYAMDCRNMALARIYGDKEFMEQSVYYMRNRKRPFNVYISIGIFFVWEDKECKRMSLFL